MEEIMDPGELTVKQISITNNSDKSETFYLNLMGFEAKGDKGQVRLIEPDASPSIFSSWVDFPDQGIEVGPGERKEVKYTINIPENAGPGGHYGAILVGNKPAKDVEGAPGDKGAVISVSQQTASLILLHITGDVVENARVKEFFTEKKIYSTPFEINFNTTIENLGNVHIKPIGIIKIKNMAGMEVEEIDFNKTNSNILPGTIREFERKWADKFGFGRYSAELVLSYGTDPASGGEGKKSLTSYVHFWILPSKIVIPALIGLVAVVILLIIFVKLQKKRAIKKTLSKMGLSENHVSGSGVHGSPLKRFLLIFALFSAIFIVVALLSFFLFF
jgi:preprotein translocase subunit SecG